VHRQTSTLTPQYAQKYLRGQGYDVKQGPDPEGDEFWIEHGNPFF
jgi:hypothetical protein